MILHDIRYHDYITISSYKSSGIQGCLFPTIHNETYSDPTAPDLVAVNVIGIYTISVLPWRLGNHDGWQRRNDCIDATMTVWICLTDPWVDSMNIGARILLHYAYKTYQIRPFTCIARICKFIIYSYCTILYIHCVKIKHMDHLSNPMSYRLVNVLSQHLACIDASWQVCNFRLRESEQQKNELHDILVGCKNRLFRT